jgi:hypothetical protein
LLQARDWISTPRATPRAECRLDRAKLLIVDMDEPPIAALTLRSKPYGSPSCRCRQRAFARPLQTGMSRQAGVAADIERHAASLMIDEMR